jgi:hypothetical protein
MKILTECPFFKPPGATVALNWAEEAVFQRSLIARDTGPSVLSIRIQKVSRRNVSRRAAATESLSIETTWSLKEYEELPNKS